MKNQLTKNQNKIVLRLILIVIAISMMGCEFKSKVSLADLKCEYRVNPLGIDNTKPRFSWKLVEEKQSRGQRQKAFQVLVASSLDNLNKNIAHMHL